MLINVEVKKALPISILAVLPDLDALFLVHRSLSHSLVVVLGVTVPLLLLTYKFKPRLQGYVLLALLAVASHLILDLFSGYTPILWPLYGYSVWIQAGLVTYRQFFKSQGKRTVAHGTCHVSAFSELGRAIVHG
jgi:membrane-bound metal-dependent hydrolase YbcI (DUF457 family)